MATKLSFFGLNRMYQQHINNISELRLKADISGQFLSGENSISLENSLSAQFKREYSITVGSGTDALFLSLNALKIQPDDEVLIPAFSFIASATAITRTGAKPIFVDIDPKNALMDLSDAEQKITNKTKAIIFVDLYGNLPNIKALEEFAQNHDLKLIEDAAQAIGSERDGGKAGSIGDISIFSFDPTKPIHAFGTGGAILTNNKEVAHYCKAASQNGKNPKTGKYDQFGINSRISESQAALIQWQLENYEEQLAVRKQLAERYRSNLNKLPVEILVNEQFQYTGNFHKFVIQTKQRDALKQHLASHGIETRIHYAECLYYHPILSDFRNQCFNAETLSKEVLSLPFYPELNIAEIDYICEKIKTFYS
ncbi:MAG: DegT/DnrJ/EryC1/StrS family aminotransferase [Bacteroidota bacterium]|nr:DegT/DnrJ/EryC1/StrS family aminotransferase [Bacteroidota bacterium]